MKFLFPMDVQVHDLHKLIVVQNWSLSQPSDWDVFRESEWNEIYYRSYSDSDVMKCLEEEMKLAWIIWKTITKTRNGCKGVVYCIVGLSIVKDLVQQVELCLSVQRLFWMELERK